MAIGSPREPTSTPSAPARPRPGSWTPRPWRVPACSSTAASRPSPRPETSSSPATRERSRTITFLARWEKCSKGRSPAASRERRSRSSNPSASRWRTSPPGGMCTARRWLRYGGSPSSSDVQRYTLSDPPKGSGGLAMKGVKFVIDENGERSAVLIDLNENAELWEDFCDAYVAREREGEPRESMEEVRQRLQAQGKLSRSE